jgi:hypothetical protein
MSSTLVFPRVGGLHHRYSRVHQRAAQGGNGRMTMDTQLHSDQIVLGAFS